MKMSQELYDACVARFKEREGSPNQPKGTYLVPSTAVCLDVLDIFNEHYYSDVCRTSDSVDDILDRMMTMWTGPFESAEEWATEEIKSRACVDDEEGRKWIIGEYIWEHVNWKSLTESMLAGIDVKLHESPDGDIYAFVMQ